MNETRPPDDDFVTDEARLLARILEVCREIRVILQRMADKDA